MQRPRRTSELQDDPGVIKRQSRTQQRNTLVSPSGSYGALAAGTGGAIRKSSLRQSRIAVPSRLSSSEQIGSSTPYLSVPLSTVKRRVTPQKTPLSKASANRVLFTAEKLMHNDKKWVNEQTQRITEHLLSKQTLGGGISTEFLSRGLRQMSIKQFVAIINYFLGYIWGNRYTVGSNHVDDIINIMQKLKYPHPLNKSWLKTPNTQHSFGNVIVLLDFLMDFLPPDEKEHTVGMYFDLKEPEVPSASRINEDALDIPDLEFQEVLLENSEKGFLLWDKQKDEEFDRLKFNTCNLLIQKICGLPGLDAVNSEIEKLRRMLKTLQKERLPEDKEALKIVTKLSNELKSIHRDIKSLQEESDAYETNIKDMKSRKMQTAAEVETVGIEIISLQEKLNMQSCTIEQRDNMITVVMRHKHLCAIKERAVQNLEDRYQKEQVLQSKTIKRLNDQIEKFNDHMREIKFSNFVNLDTSQNEQNLELSLRPKQSELDKLIPVLKKINETALRSLHENKEKIFVLQDKCNKLTVERDTYLHTKLNSLRAANASNAANLKTLINAHQEDECKLLEEIQKVENQLVTAEKTIQELQARIKSKTSQAEDLANANEQTMQQAEQIHRQHAEQKRTFLKAYDELLDECIQSDFLQRLREQVEQQEKQLEEFSKAFPQ